MTNRRCMLCRSYGRRERPTNLFIEPSLIGSATRLFIMYPGGPLTLRPVAGKSDMLSGGGFGPEASLAAQIVS